MNAERILHELSQPLDVNRVSKRQGGGGKALSYLEAHDVISKLNEIFGYDGWRDKVREFVAIEGAPTPMFRCTLDIEARIGADWITHTGVGVGIASNSKGVKAEDLEKCAKEAESDALKRAARKFGPQFGNDLYDKDAPEHRGQMRQAPAAHSPGTACTEQQVAFYEQAREFAKSIGVPQVTGSISVGAPLWKLDKKLNTLAEMVAMFQGPTSPDDIEGYGTDAPHSLQERVTAEMHDRNHIDTRKVATAVIVEQADNDRDSWEAAETDDYYAPHGSDE